MPIQPMKVDYPRLPPQACICGTQTGPLLDTGIELQPYGTVYLCAICAKLVSVTMGHVEGKELDRLMDADKLLTQERQQSERLQGRVYEQAGEKNTLEKRLETALAELELERGRNAQLQTTVLDVRRDLEQKLATLMPAVPPLEPEDEAKAVPVG